MSSKLSCLLSLVLVFILAGFAQAELLVNGDFEAGRAGWAAPDNVSTKLVADPRAGRRGKVLRNRPGAGHLKSRKSPSRIRRFRQEVQLPKTFAKHAKKMMAS